MDDPTRRASIERLELERLSAKAESKEKEAEVLEDHARDKDKLLIVEARAKRAEAKTYKAEIRERTGVGDFLRGMGIG